MLKLYEYIELFKYLKDKALCNISLCNKRLYNISYNLRCGRKGMYYIVHSKHTYHADNNYMYFRLYQPAEYIKYEYINIDLDCLKYFYYYKYNDRIHNSNIQNDIFISAIINDHLDQIIWMYENNIISADMINNNILDYSLIATIHDKLNILQWFYQNNLINDRKIIHNIFLYAIIKDNINICRWSVNTKMLEDYLQIDSNIIQLILIAVKGKNIKMGKYIFDIIKFLIKDDKFYKCQIFYHCNFELKRVKHFLDKDEYLNRNDTEQYTEYMLKLEYLMYIYDNYVDYVDIKMK